jgi:dihydrofolate reductase
MIIIIAAVGLNNEIGKDNRLIWNIKKDLEFFKKKTSNSIIVMGRATFNSLPRILPNRKHIVLSTKNDFNKEIDDNVEIFNDKDLLIKKCLELSEKQDVFIIGGASLYNIFIDIADKMYITHIEATDKEADTYFPKISEKDWGKTILSRDNETGISFSHVEYKRY